MTDSTRLSRRYLALIIAAILGVGLCTLAAGLVSSTAEHVLLWAELIAVSMSLAAIIAGLALHASSQRAAALKAAERGLRENARRDQLTDLLNRSAFLETLGEKVKLAGQGEPLALFVLDVDRFKEANDSHGHAMGDAILRHIGSVLKWELEDASIGRLGGDEFAFILQGLASKSVCERIANRVLKILKRPARLCSALVETSASIGVAWAPEHSLAPDELMRFADLALYSAKAAGRGTVRCFDRQLMHDHERKAMIERALARALSREGELEVHYQPIIAQGGAKIAGAEALLRWRHPEHGLIPPGEFIPIAEEIGLIDRLGQFVFDRVLRDAQAWPELVLNVNLSPAQLRANAFSTMLRAKIETAGFDPRRLVLEITEGVLLECGPDQLSQIADLRALGIRISLDDFGAGYSSLAYVRDFPLDEIKIDRSYVSALPVDPRSGVLVSAICELARGLNLLVVAEGVETEEHLQLVKAAGCTSFQGFHFAKPMAAQEFSGFLANWTSHGSQQAA